MTILKPPVTAAQFPHEWLAGVRDAIATNRYSVRGHATLPAIEALSPVTGCWMPLLVHTSVVEFASITDRDTVLGQITGRIPIPPQPSPSHE